MSVPARISLGGTEEVAKYFHFFVEEGCHLWLFLCIEVLLKSGPFHIKIFNKKNFF